MSGKIFSYPTLKRAGDVAVASAGLILLSPVMAATAATVAVKLGRPVFFKQQRPGKDGKPFELIKFRTMLEATPTRTSDEDRMSKVGRVLRSTSLDELPTLFNVLKGDMSLVGPRPLLMSYLERYNDEQKRRHEVRPGITGLAQARGRNSLSWEDKFRLDVEYVDSMSLRLDVKILLETIQTTLRREGINQPGHVTMTEFQGSDVVTHEVTHE